MKVLHLFPEFRRGGAPVNTLRFIKATAGKLDHIVAGHAADRELFEEYQPYAETIDIDLTRPAPSSFLRLWRTARRTKPDIIHANGKAGTVYGLLLSAVLPRANPVLPDAQGLP